MTDRTYTASVPLGSVAPDSYPVVFVPQFNGRLDISDAERFGKLRVLFNREIYPDTIDDVMPSVMERVRLELSRFRPDVDYLLLVGSPVHQAACFLTLGRLLGDRAPAVRTLRHDRVEGRYYVAALE